MMRIILCFDMFSMLIEIVFDYHYKK